MAAPLIGQNDQLVGGIGGNDKPPLVAIAVLDLIGNVAVSAQRPQPAHTREHHGDGLALDQGLVGHVDHGCGAGNGGPARHPVRRLFGQEGFELVELAADGLPLRPAVVEQVFDLRAFFEQRLTLFAQLHLLELAQRAQPGVEDVFALRLGEVKGADQLGARIVLLADDADHFVEVEEDHHQALDPLQMRVDLAQTVARAPDQHFMAVIEEGPQRLAQVQHTRHGIGIEHVQVHRHPDFDVGVAEQALHQVRGLDVAALGLNHDADVGGGLVADVGAQVQLLRGDQLASLFQQSALGDLVGDLGHGDLPGAGLELFDFPSGAQPHRATTGLVDLLQRVGVLDQQPAGGEIRSGNEGHQVFDRRLGIVDQMAQGAQQLADVVGRYGRGHAHSDALRAVGQQVGEGRRQDHRLLFLAIIGVAEINGVFVDVAQQHRGDFGQLGLGVAVSSSVIAVDVAEVALAVDQRVALDEILSQPHQRVVDRGIPVRVVLTDDLADDGRTLARAGAGVDLELAHGIEHPSLDRLQAVANVGQGARHDGRQGVGKVALGEGRAKIHIADITAIVVQQIVVISRSGHNSPKPEGMRIIY